MKDGLKYQQNEILMIHNVRWGKSELKWRENGQYHMNLVRLVIHLLTWINNNLIYHIGYCVSATLT